MKTKLALLLLLPAALLAAASCEDFGITSAEGELTWGMDPGSEAFTKVDSEIPDSNDFILTVKGPKGEVIYDGPFGESPESLLLKAGNYTVSVRSILFTAPAFSRPQYGDDQVVVVRGGESVGVKLNCSLLNSGIRLKMAPEFLSAFPSGVMYVASDEGRLMYGYSEKRIAFFKPGAVSVILNDSGSDETLLTRNLEPREILTVGISASSGGGEATGSSISVSVDTTKIWNYESYVIGGENGGPSSGDDGSGGENWEDDDGIGSAIGVADAPAHVGEKGVWVFGYIVGGDLTTSGSKVKTDKITKSTHLAIAARSSVTDKESCVAVELSKGKVRDALNLVDHPDLIGTRVYVKGDIVEKYFGITGVKNVTDYATK